MNVLGLGRAKCWIWKSSRTYMGVFNLKRCEKKRASFEYKGFCCIMYGILWVYSEWCGKARIFICMLQMWDAFQIVYMIGSIYSIQCLYNKNHIKVIQEWKFQAHKLNINFTALSESSFSRKFYFALKKPNHDFKRSLSHPRTSEPLSTGISDTRKTQFFLRQTHSSR